MAGSKHDRHDKIRRLHEHFLDAKKPIAMPEILCLLQCSRKTAERVIAECRALGTPIEHFRENGHYLYRLTNSPDGAYQLPGIWFHKEELVALFAIQGMIQDIPDGLLSGQLKTLWSRVQAHCESLYLDWDALKDKVKILPIAGRIVEDAHFRCVVEALMKGQRVSICYKSLNAKENLERDVSPLRILRYRDNWYMDAYCHHRNDLRSFALSRITASKLQFIEAQPVSVEKQDLFYAQSYGIFTGAADKVAKVHFTGIAALEVSKELWHPKQESSWPDAQTFELNIPYHKDDELIMDLLRWGELANILSPQELRDRAASKITLMHTNYKS